MLKSSSVCIIGAGISGLITCKNLKNAGFSRIKVYEQMSQIGGAWVTKSPSGERLDSAIYDGLLTNLTPELMHIDGHPYPPDTELFFSTEKQLSYIRGIAAKEEVEKHVFLDHKVIRCTKNFDKSFSVKFYDKKKNKICSENFKYICVCSGHYSVRNIPKIKGLESNPVIFQHSKGLGQGEISSLMEKIRKKNKSPVVVIVGSGASANDLNYYFSRLDGVKIYNSTRSQRNKYRFSDKKIITVPEISEIFRNGVVRFKKGTDCTPDLICFATGYVYDFPFFDSKSLVKRGSGKIYGLYKLLLYAKDPQIAFVGMTRQVIPSRVADIQSKWLARYWSGYFTVSKSALEAAAKAKEENEFTLGSEMFPYMNNLIEEMNSGTCDDEKVEPLAKDLRTKYETVGKLRLKKRGY